MTLFITRYTRAEAESRKEVFSEDWRDELHESPIVINAIEAGLA